MWLTRSAITGSTPKLRQLLCRPSHSVRHSSAAGAGTTAKQEKCNRNHGPTDHPALSPPFIGSSSRFTTTSPVLCPDDIAALEKEALSHHEPNCWNDYFCVSLVKLLRWCADKLFRERYVHRATMLKVIAPAPAQAGATVAKLRMYLKKGDVPYLPNSVGFPLEVRVLMAQMECHASHVNILLSMCEITAVERCAALFLFGLHYFIFFFLFLCYPRMAFRLLGYLNEESVVIWTHMINDVELGKVVERPVPQTAIEYWGLHRFNEHQQPWKGQHPRAAAEAPSNAAPESYAAKISGGDIPVTRRVSLREMLLLLRSDEMVWRDVCHAAADTMDKAHRVG